MQERAASQRSPSKPDLDKPASKSAPGKPAAPDRAKPAAPDRAKPAAPDRAKPAAPERARSGQNRRAGKVDPHAPAPAGGARPGPEVRAPAAPAAAIATPPPAITSNPVTAPAGDLDPGLAGRLARYAGVVNDEKRRIDQTAVVVHGKVVRDANDRAQVANAAFAAAQADLVNEFAARTHEITSLGTTARSSVEEICRSRRQEVDRVALAQAQRVETLHGAKAKEGRKAADSRADDLETYSETNAKRVEDTSAANAARAIQIGKIKAAKYKDESRADDIEEMATGLAKETAESFTDRATKTAASIRDDAREVAGKLREVGTDIEGKFAKQAPEAKDGIDAARDKARGGLDDLASKSLPEIDKMVAAPLAKLPAIHALGAAELERLRVGIIGAITTAAGHLASALALGAQQRIDDLDRTAATTFARVDELRRGDPQSVDEALSGHEDGYRRAGDVYSTEIITARDTGLAEIDRMAATGATAAGSAGQRMASGVGDLVAQVRQPVHEATSPIERDANKLRDDATKTMVVTADDLEHSYDEAIQKVGTELDPKVTEAKAAVDKKVNECLPQQEEDLRQLDSAIDDKAKELIEETWLDRIGDFIVDALEFIGGLLAGVLWAVLKFVVGLIVLIGALIVAIGALILLIGALIAMLAVLVGAELALLIGLIVALVVAAVLAIVALVVVIYGLITTIVGIFKGFWRAATEKDLSPFERGFLTGESAGDLVLLLLPFKAKIPGLRAIPIPKWVPKFIVGEHPAVPELPESPVKLPAGELPPAEVAPKVEPLPKAETPTQPEVEAPTEAPTQPKVEPPPTQPKVEAPPKQDPPKQEAAKESTSELKKQQDLAEIADEEAKIEAEATSSKVPPEEADNWEEVQKLLGQKLGSKAPKGYTIFERGGRRFLRRIEKDPKKWVQLTVDENGNISLPKASQRISIPGELAKNLGPRPTEPHQAHHLIPDEVVRQNTLMRLAREKTGYNLDRKSNGIYLPETEAARANTPASKDLPLHRGSHPQYSRRAEAIAEELLSDLKEIHGSTEAIPPAELARAAEQLEARMLDLVKNWKTLTGEEKLR